VRDRGALGDAPGDLVPLVRETDLPDGSDPPPLRDEGVVRDEDHGALLDHRGDPLRRRGRALLQVLPVHQTAMKGLPYGLARSGEAAGAALEVRGDEVVRADLSLGNEDDLSLLDGIELLVKSPGVPRERALVEEARERGIPVWSELELGWQLLAPS